MKKLLAILALISLVSASTVEARWFRGGRGGNCGSCKPCGKKTCVKACYDCPTDNCPPVTSCPGQAICITPPCADVRKPCEKAECAIEEVPVKCFRKVKRCVVETAGPVEFDCPITDEIVEAGGAGQITIGDQQHQAEEYMNNGGKKHKGGLRRGGYRKKAMNN